ncbi:TPA: hypothetical protein I7712_20410 [Vibrio vulnificus]|nr:hypothetical protein [Vibrio vulnificus]HAS8510764.1 hypothetical protein [Vibrio vulnificus]
MKFKSAIYILLFTSLWLVNPFITSLLILMISLIYPYKPLIIVFGVLLSIYYGFVSYSMDSVGDFLNYKENITDVINNGLDFSIRGGEFGYYLIVSIVGFFLDDSVEMTHGTMLIIANLILFIFLYKINHRRSIFIFLLLQLFSVLVINPYLSRQFLAVSIILYSLSLNKGKSVLWIASILIHFSSILYMCVLLMSRKILRNKRVVLISIFTSLFLFFTMNLDMFKVVLNQNILPEFIKVKADFYLRMQDSEQKLDVFVVVFCIFTFFLKYKSCNTQYSEMEENILNLFFISAILCLSFINLPVLPTRLGYLTYYLSPLLLVFILRENKFNMLNAINLVFLCFCILIATYKIYLNDFSEPWLSLSDGDIITRELLFYINRL